MNIQAIASDSHAIAIYIQTIDTDSHATAVDIQAIAIDRREIGIYIQEIAANRQAIAIYIQTMTANTQEIGIYTQEIDADNAEIAENSQFTRVAIKIIRILFTAETQRTQKTIQPPVLRSSTAEGGQKSAKGTKILSAAIRSRCTSDAGQTSASLHTILGTGRVVG
jgi:hypothetical protein